MLGTALLFYLTGGPTRVGGDTCATLCPHPAALASAETPSAMSLASRRAPRGQVPDGLGRRAAARSRAPSSGEAG